MAKLTYTVDQISSLASQYIATHGQAEWSSVHFDGTNLVVPDALVAKVQALDPSAIAPDAIKSECKRRIIERIDEVAQQNLAAERAADRLDTTQQAAYIAGLDWIMAMRAKCGQLIAANDGTYANDNHWPACPQSVIDLVAQY